MEIKQSKATPGLFGLYDDQGKRVRWLLPSEAEAGEIEHAGQKLKLPGTIDISKRVEEAKKSFEEAKQERAPIKISREAQILPSAGEPGLIEEYAPIVGNIVGNLAGSATGFPVLGGLIGGGSGTVLSSLLEAKRKAEAAITPSDLSRKSYDPVGQMAVGTGLDLLTEGALKAPGAKSALIRRVSKLGRERVLIEPEVKQFLLAHKNFPVTMGQLTKGWISENLENVAAHTAKKDITDVQQKMLRDIYRNYVPEYGPEMNAAAMRYIVSNGKSTLRSEADNLFEATKNEATKNRYRFKMGPPGLGKIAPPPGSPAYGGIGAGVVQSTFGTGIDIKGPVLLNESRAAALEMLGPMEEFAKGLPEDMKQSVETMRKLATGREIISMEEALDLKRTTGTKGFQNYMGNAQEGAFKKLNAELGNDIRASISNPKFKYQDPQKLLSSYEKQNKRWELYQTLYKDTPEINALLDNQAIESGKDAVSKTLLDGKRIDNMLEAAQNPVAKETGRRTLRNQMLDEMFAEAGGESDVFKKDKLLEVFKSQKWKHAVDRLVDSGDKTALTNLFSAIKHFDPKVPEAGLTAMKIHGGFAALNLATGLGTYAMTGDAKIAGLPVLAAYLGAHQVGKLLTNPKAVRVATQLAQTPAANPRAKALVRSLVQLTKGSGIVWDIATKDGVKIGTAESDGKRLVPEQIESR